MVRTIIVLVLLAIGGVLLGWWHFSATTSSATVSINKDKIEKDTRQAVEKVQTTIQNQMAPKDSPAADQR